MFAPLNIIYEESQFLLVNLFYLALVENRLSADDRAHLILPHQALHAGALECPWRGEQKVFRASPEEWFARFCGMAEGAESTALELGQRAITPRQLSPSPLRSGGEGRGEEAPSVPLETSPSPPALSPLRCAGRGRRPGAGPGGGNC